MTAVLAGTLFTSPRDHTHLFTLSWKHMRKFLRFCIDYVIRKFLYGYLNR
jgi:hypothetical protein